MKKTITRSFENYRKKFAKYLLTGFALLSSLSILAQNNTTKGEDTFGIFSNPLFCLLLFVIILLLIIISVLGGALKNVAAATKYENNKESKSGKIAGLITLIALLSINKTTFAQEGIKAANSAGFMGLSSSLFYVLITFIGFEMFIILMLVNAIKLLVKKEKEEKEEKAKVISIKKKAPSFLDKFNSSVAIENEKDILMDHDYDGIKELDNNLPPWWKYGFYLTIIIAICYLTYFHLLGGELQIMRYEKSLVEAKAAQEEYLKDHGDIINEENVKLITDKSQLTEAEKIFKTSCFACHGADGQGNAVGPNLTDDFWIHGGSIKNVFSTISNGWPEKGMKSWKTDFSPLQINQLASYVKALRGSNPPNPKEKQGDLYVEPAPAKDSADIILKAGVNIGPK